MLLLGMVHCQVDGERNQMTSDYVYLLMEQGCLDNSYETNVRGVYTYASLAEDALQELERQNKQRIQTVVQYKYWIDTVPINQIIG